MMVQDLGQIKVYQGQLNELWNNFKVKHIQKYAPIQTVIPNHQFEISTQPLLTLT